MRYTDPSGHWVPQRSIISTSDQVHYLPDLGSVGAVYDTEGGQSIMRESLKIRAEAMVPEVERYLETEDGLTAADVNRELIDLGVRYSRNDNDVFMETTPRIFADYEVNDPLTNATERRSGRSGDDQVTIPGSQGFQSAYHDPSPAGSQTLHFWYYARYAHANGYNWAMAGNIYHEFWPSETGSSMADYWLGDLGAQLGTLLGAYEHYGMRPADIVPWMDEYVFD